ncbi:ABC transporter substrate-binding protein [Aeromicrobium alkaliterrae]|uniref:ABC transporter family substrate-binding protein n=1 Tax=Aeromicrobium alkaliterrae TaxID=302168 RepID=A0ABP4W262_9ACTN
MSISSRPGRHLSVGSWRLTTLALVAALLLAGCSGDPDPLEVERTQVRDGGTLRLAVDAMPTTFNVGAAPIGDTATTVLEPTRGGAVLVADDGSWSVDERYATAVEVVSADPLAIAVTLNPEAVWSDGSTIDTADMQAYASAQIASAGQASAEVDTWSVVAGVDPGADAWSYTVRFTRPTADWPALIYPGLPAEATAAEVYNAFTDVAPPSNGPFVVAEINRESGLVRLERNPQWWGETAALEAVEYRALDGSAQAEGFTGGDLDAIELTPAGADSVEEGVVSTAPGREWSHLTLNAARGPLTSIAVRQAVALALDRGALAKATGSDAEVAGSFVTVPGEAGYTDTVGDLLTPDAEAARDLIASAGYVESGDGWAGPDGTPLTLRLPVPEGNEAAATRAEAVSADLADIGIEVTIEPRPVETFFSDVVVPLDFDLVTFLWSSDPLRTASAIARVQPVDSPLNFTGLADPGVAQAADALLRAIDPEAFSAAAAAFDTAVLATWVIVPLVVEPHVLAVGEDVVNLTAHRFAVPDWTTVGFRA